MAPHDRMKYLNVGLTIFQEHEIKAFDIFDNWIEVDCNVTDKNELADLKTYGWKFNTEIGRWTFEGLYTENRKEQL